MTFVPGKPKWWQWATILSLDAPLVVSGWQALIARAAGVDLLAHHRLLLAASVWLAYSADRWMEGWRLSEDAVRTQRHFFAIRWRWPLLAVWMTALPVSLAAALLFLTPLEWRVCLAVLVPTVLYLVSHQFLHRNHPWRVPKEICVAAILTAGAAAFPFAGDALWQKVAAPSALFFALALANCLLISEWERDVDAAQRQTSLALRTRRLLLFSRVHLVTVMAASAVAATRSTGDARLAWLAGVGSAALLLVLARVEPLIGRERARVLVDVALLTPLLLFLP